MRGAGSGDTCPHAGHVSYGGREEYCSELDRTVLGVAIERLDTLLSGAEDVQESEHYRCHTSDDGCSIERKIWWIGDETGEMRSPVHLEMDVAYKRPRQGMVESYDVSVGRVFYHSLKKTEIVSQYALEIYKNGSVFGRMTDSSAINKPHSQDNERPMTRYDLRQLIGELGCVQALTEAGLLEEKALGYFEQ